VGKSLVEEFAQHKDVQYRIVEFNVINLSCLTLHQV
jgi:hypothetical protein